MLCFCCAFEISWWGTSPFSTCYILSSFCSPPPNNVPETERRYYVKPELRSSASSCSDYQRSLTNREKGSPCSSTCPQCKCSLTMNAAVPYRQTVHQWGGFVLWNTSLASSQLSRAHSRQQNTHKWEDDEMKGTVMLPMKGQSPRWNRCSCSMIPFFLKKHGPLSQQWRYNEWLCIRSTAACVSANQQRWLLLVTITALTEALHITVPWQPF